MKNIMIILAAGLLWAASAPLLLAEESSAEVTLKGLMVCGKCTLHICPECQNVLQVEKDGKTVNYFLDQNSVSKDFHSNICTTDGEKVRVTGTVKEEGDKKILKASKIEPEK
jgi:hypothetical protein